MKNSPSQPLVSELVYSRSAGYAESVITVEIKYRPQPWVVIDQGGHVAKMPATAGVLADTAHAVANISERALQAGEATIGERGRRLLARLRSLEATPTAPSRPARRRVQLAV